MAGIELVCVGVCVYVCVCVGVCVCVCWRVCVCVTCAIPRCVGRSQQQIHVRCKRQIRQDTVWDISRLVDIGDMQIRHLLILTFISSLFRLSDQTFILHFQSYNGVFSFYHFH